MGDLEPVHIAIVSKSRLFRDGLKRLLDETNFDTVCEVEEVRQLNEKRMGESDENMVLFDAGVTAPTNIEDVKSLTSAAAETPVVVLADVLDPRMLVDCMGAGASGYLLKDISTDALISSLRLVQSGEKVFPTHMAALLLRGTQGLISAPSSSADLGILSNREGQILSCLVDGESNKMIARKFRVTEATVKVHMKSLMRKIGCRNRTQAAIWAISHGISGSAEQLNPRHRGGYESRPGI